MATQTNRVGFVTDAAGNVCTLEYDYNDVTLNVIALRCINNTPRQAFASLTDTVNNRTFSQTFAANQTSALTVPTGAQTRLHLTLDARGRLDGAEVQLGLV